MTTCDITALPSADAEQRYLIDEIEHEADYDRFQHGVFPRWCAEQSRPLKMVGAR